MVIIDTTVWIDYLRGLRNKETDLVQDIPVENLDSTAARAYGEIRSTFEEKGRLIRNNDLWIGAHAMALDVTLATNNEREFRRIAGLPVEN